MANYYYVDDGEPSVMTLGQIQHDAEANGMFIADYADNYCELDQAATGDLEKCVDLHRGSERALAAVRRELRRRAK